MAPNRIIGITRDMKIPANKNQQQTFPDYELLNGILSDNLLDKRADSDI